MRNKGIFKIFFTKRLEFAFGRTAYKIGAEFTLSQCRIGWISLSNNIQIHLVFVDIWIDHWRFKSHKIAKQFIEDSECDVW